MLWPTNHETDYNGFPFIYNIPNLQQMDTQFLIVRKRAGISTCVSVY